MIKTNYGYIKNNKTGETKDIVINAISKKNMKHLLIGGGISMIGIIYVMLTAFKSGAHAYEIAEYEALESLGLFIDCNNQDT